MVKELILKVRKFWGLIPTFVEVSEENLVGGGIFAPPLLPSILNRVETSLNIFDIDICLNLVNFYTYNMHQCICSTQNAE